MYESTETYEEFEESIEDIEGSEEDTTESELLEDTEESDSGDGTNSGEVELSETQCTVSVDLDYIPIEGELNDLGLLGVGVLLIIFTLAIFVVGGLSNDI